MIMILSSLLTILLLINFTLYIISFVLISSLILSILILCKHSKIFNPLNLPKILVLIFEISLLLSSNFIFV